MSESWRDIPGYEGMYQVSDMGRVRSLERIVITRNGRRFPVRERILSPYADRDGYMIVNLYKKPDGMAAHKVHRLVRISFVGAEGGSVDVHHENRDKTDNSLSNLSGMDKSVHWILHAPERALSVPRGERHPMAKLSDSTAVEVVRLIDSGTMTHADIARMFGVSRRLVGMVGDGSVWSHATGRGRNAETDADVEDHRTQRQ